MQLKIDGEVTFKKSINYHNTCEQIDLGDEASCGLLET
jgi:hypothetical protein